MTSKRRNMFYENKKQETTSPTHVSVLVLIAQWVPQRERSWRGAAILSAAQTGKLITVLVSSRMVSDWMVAYYVAGTVGFVSSVAFGLMASSNPDRHPYLPRSERRLMKKYRAQITQSSVRVPSDYFAHVQTKAVNTVGGRDQNVIKLNGRTRLTSERERYVSTFGLVVTDSPSFAPGMKAQSTPWKKILKTKAVWAYFLSLFCYTWLTFIESSIIYTFIGKIMGISMRDRWYWMVLGQTLDGATGVFSGWVAETLVENMIVSRSLVKKIFAVLSGVVPVCCLLGVTYCGCDPTSAIVLILVEMSFIGFSYPSILLNSVELTPNYSGSVDGIAYSLISFGGMAVPFVIQAVIRQVSIRFNHTFGI
ncbi:hypothetical protein AAG570_013642 [Ranatra chinensis]|uniref:Uncharacterized protein n=1 Tax=Ranatra chinensis TaxID=642074 RepID=A0ABD0YD18_9HEMI